MEYVGLAILLISIFSYIGIRSDRKERQSRHMRDRIFRNDKDDFDNQLGI